MKKLMFAAAIAAAFAATAEIESANTVGYTSMDVAAGRYYLVGTQFDKAGTTSAGSIDMNDLIKLSPTLAPGLYSNDFATAPQISVLNAAGGYTTYYYISDGTDDNDVDLGANAWCDVDGYELSGSQIDAGVSFWIYSPTTTGSVTFSL